jgi:tetratricopeptide (TPR) repeat protein
MNEGISLCMIVLNEEKWLENCLNSIKDLVDEMIIVVDTRSKDKSKEIAKKFTDKIYNFEWCDDFSKAHNFALSKATKKWVLNLDADEVIADIDKEKIKKIIKLNKGDAFYFNWRDYVNATGFYGWISSKGDKYKESNIAQGFYNSKVLRFFKNKKQYFFEGKIHETPYNSIIKSNGEIFDTDIVMHHFGNLDKGKFIEKRKEYIRLLKQRIKNKDFKEKAEDYVYFEIANELTNIGEFKEAILFYIKAIELNELPVYLLGLGALYIHEKQYNDAERVLKKAVVLEPQNPAIHNNLGVVYVEKKEHNKAIRKYEKAIELKSDFADAYFNLGIVYRLNGKLNKVEDFFEKAIELNPSFKEKIEEAGWEM